MINAAAYCQFNKVEGRISMGVFSFVKRFSPLQLMHYFLSYSSWILCVMQLLNLMNFTYRKSIFSSNNSKGSRVNEYENFQARLWASIWWLPLCSNSRNLDHFLDLSFLLARFAWKGPLSFLSRASFPFNVSFLLLFFPRSEIEQSRRKTWVYLQTEMLYICLHRLVFKTKNLSSFLTSSPIHRFHDCVTGKITFNICIA